MTALIWLVPIALLLGGLGLVAFLWCLRAGQFDDLEGAGWRALDDECPIPKASVRQPVMHPSNTRTVEKQVSP